MIRGQADNRVRVLNNGTEVFDVSNLSPDHAPSVSTLLSQSIEVVRGPATILYGSERHRWRRKRDRQSYSGGATPPTMLSGEVDARFNSVDLERSGAMALTLSPFKHFVIHAEGSAFAHRRPKHSGFRLGSAHSR